VVSIKKQHNNLMITYIYYIVLIDSYSRQIKQSLFMGMIKTYVYNTV
jgi:hypothetical protein